MSRLVSQSACAPGSRSRPRTAAKDHQRDPSRSQGVERTYYSFVPDSAKDKPAPLIDPAARLRPRRQDPGRALAVAGEEGRHHTGRPRRHSSRRLGQRDDGPLFIRHVVEAVQTDYAVDRRAMYVFGHSAGAIFGISMGVLESEYFAAVAVHAGALSPSIVPVHRARAAKDSDCSVGRDKRSRISGRDRCVKASIC